MTASIPIDLTTGIASMLFVSGATPERFEKALASEADLVCIDLEDAVPASGKAAARAKALQALGDPRLALRINAITTRAGIEDLLAVADATVTVGPIFVPMVESPDELRVVTAVLGRGDISLVPLIETPRGLRNALAVAQAPSVKAMMFGGGDLAAALGVPLEWEPLLAARGAFLLACAEAGVPAIDVPFVKLDDPAGLEAECARSAGLGFQAKAAIHPAQLSAISDAFRPSPAMVQEAAAARVAFEAAKGAVTNFKGRMLEAPLMRRYDRILAQAKRIGTDA